MKFTRDALRSLCAKRDAILTAHSQLMTRCTSRGVMMARLSHSCVESPVHAGLLAMSKVAKSPRSSMSRDRVDMCVPPVANHLVRIDGWPPSRHIDYHRPLLCSDCDLATVS